MKRTPIGAFRIVRGVAPDRVISTVDPEARHGHKTAARGFDGCKGHLAVDAESEIITATEVTAGNVGDSAFVPLWRQRNQAVLRRHARSQRLSLLKMLSGGA